MFDETMLQNLYRYSYSLTTNEHDAYDLLQGAIEKFIKIYPAPEHSTAYIKKIIHNQFVDNYRRDMRIQFEPLDEALIPVDFDIKTLEHIVIDENLVEKMMRFLKPDEREIIYFWAVEGLSATQIAEQLDVPRGTVLSKIFRMRKKIIERFDVEYTGRMEDAS